MKKNHVLLLSPDKTHYGFKHCQSETTFYWLHISHFGNYFQSDYLYPPDRTVTSPYHEAPFHITLPKQKRLTEEEADALSEYIKPLISFDVNKYNNETRKFKLPASPPQNQRNFIDILDYLNLCQKTENPQKTLAFQIMQYLQNNYDKHFTIEDLANKYNFHPVHVIRTVKRTYHATPIQILTRIRLEKAKELLAVTTSTVSEVADQVGFASSSYFIKVFKAQYQFTPNEYRKQLF